MQEHTNLSLHLSLPNARLNAWLPIICYALSLTTTTYTLAISQNLLLLLETVYYGSVSSMIPVDAKPSVITSVSMHLSSTFYWLFMFFHFLVFIALVWTSVTSAEHAENTKGDMDTRADDAQKHEGKTMDSPQQDVPHILEDELLRPDSEETLSPESPDCTESAEPCVLCHRRPPMFNPSAPMVVVRDTPYLQLVPSDVRRALLYSMFEEALRLMPDRADKEEELAIYQQLLGYIIIHNMPVALRFFLKNLHDKSVYDLEIEPDIREFIRFSLTEGLHGIIIVLQEYLPSRTQASIKRFGCEAVRDNSLSRLETAWQYLHGDTKFVAQSMDQAAKENLKDVLLFLDNASPCSLVDVDKFFIFAIQNRSYDLVKHWIGRGATTRLTSAPLYVAAEFGNADIMETLLDIHQKQYLGKSTLNGLLETAVCSQRISIANILILRGADVLSIPLDSAVAGNYDGILRKILKEKSKTTGWVPPATCLQSACLHGWSSSAKCLVEYGSDINPEGGVGIRCPLIAAVSVNHLHVVEFLISKGASFESVGYFGNALQTAAFWNYLGVAKTLLAHNFPVDAKAGSLPTALILAIRRGHCEMANLLLKKGASRDNMGRYERLVFPNRATYY